MKIINKALFSYFGNKDRESKQIMENLPDMNNIDIVIEPYCGSFSLIRNLILLYPDKKYICVDNDKKLIQAYNDIIDKYNKNIEFICDDAKNIIEEYKNNDRVFMFIDPPYLLNNIYDSTHRTDYILNFIKDLNIYNCKIIAILGNHELLKYFYEHYC